MSELDQIKVLTPPTFLEIKRLRQRVFQLSGQVSEVERSLSEGTIAHTRLEICHCLVASKDIQIKLDEMQEGEGEAGKNLEGLRSLFGHFFRNRRLKSTQSDLKEAEEELSISLLGAVLKESEPLMIHREFVTDLFYIKCTIDALIFELENVPITPHSKIQTEYARLKKQMDQINVYWFIQSLGAGAREWLKAIQNLTQQSFNPSRLVRDETWINRFSLISREIARIAEVERKGLNEAMIEYISLQLQGQDPYHSEDDEVVPATLRKILLVSNYHRLPRDR